jgi:uncharacterized protein (TIGR02231 family)
MKTLRVLLTRVLFPALLSAGWAAPLAAPSNISAVTVYLDRAVVTRSARIDLAATGVTEVTLEKLPANLLDQSLQVSGRGAAQATILDVTARATYVDFTPNERVQALELELRGLAKQRRVLDDRDAVLKAQENTLGRLEAAATAPPTKDSAPRLSIEESAKLLAFLAEQLGKIAAEKQDLSIQGEDLAAKIDAAQRQLNELRGAGGRSYKTVTVRLDAITTGTLDLAVSYAVPGASWAPSYDARVNSNEKTIALAYSGLVRQNTGEDWKDVGLTLSTARPSLGGAAPELRPWGLDIFLPRPVPMAVTVPLKTATRDFANFNGISVAGAGATNMQALTTGSFVDGKLMEKDAGYATAAMEAAATSASFKTTTPASVPSDNSPQKVPITTAALAANPEYLTTPKLQPAAFLTAKAVNSSDFPLLAGAMNVFLDGTFVATSHLRTVMAGEKFDLALGADDGISVKHQRVKRFTEETGLTNSGQRITYEYLLTIQNNKKTAARVIVADQIPVSRNEKVVVKQLSPDAKEVKPTNEGALKWTLDLKPGEKRELTLKFSIDYPNDVQVTGLEP